jgi:hypothetical protein
MNKDVSLNTAERLKKLAFPFYFCLFLWVYLFRAALCRPIFVLHKDALFHGTAHSKKCKQLFEYQHLLLLRNIWW